MTGKGFNGEFTANIDFLHRVSNVTINIADTDIGKLKSLHTLVDRYLVHTRVKMKE